MARSGIFRLLTALAFGGSIAALVILVGTGDVESYEHAFFSLDRGTAVTFVHVLGQPVYTLSLGLGVRLPLHGSLSASPAALVAPYVPVPVTYALLLTFAIAAAVLLVQHALEPMCGRVLSWLASVLLFYSVPVVNYTIYGDWPETAVTYCAYVACVYAPHAALNLLQSAQSHTKRRLAAAAVAATVWACLVLAHPGHWPLLAMTLVFTALVTLVRVDHPWPTRLRVVAMLAVVSVAAVALPALDILRELNATIAGGDTDRAVDTLPAGVLVSNLFPFGEVGARFPFTHLVLAGTSIAVSLGLPHRQMRIAVLATAAAALAMALGASALSPRGAVSAFAPSASWGLRDPAIAFAVLSGSWAAAAAWEIRSHLLKWAGVGVLALAALQGPAYAVTLVIPELTHEEAWTRDLTDRQERASQRGLLPDRVRPGTRLALWPEVRQSMRDARTPSTDLADSGYLLVTAWAKQRAMRPLIEPNGVLFNQTIEPSAKLLCDERAVRFLQLRYLLRPEDVEGCAPWSDMPGLRVDDRFDVDEARVVDDRVHALPVETLADVVARRPALADDSALLSTLVALPGTSLVIDPPDIRLRIDDPPVIRGRALVLPIAYDRAWRSSSGEVQDVGGLLALVDVDQRDVVLRFVPDLIAILRAFSMTLAQILALAGMIGLSALR